MNTDENSPRISRINWNRAKSYESELEPMLKDHNQADPEKPDEDYRGIVLAMMAGVLYAAISIIVKLLSKRSASQKALMICLGSMVFAIPALILVGQFKVSHRSLTILVLVSATFSLGLSTRYEALDRLPIGDASAILFNTPVFVAILARIVLKENIGKFTALAIFMSMLGLLLVAKLPVTILHIIQGNRDQFGTLQHVIGCSYALGSVLLCACNNLCLRLMRNTNEWVVTFLRAIFSCFFVIGLNATFEEGNSIMFVGDCSDSVDKWLFLLLGIMGPIGSILFVLAVKYEQVNVVSIIVTSTDIFISFLSQLLLFREPIDLYSCSGAILVFFSGLIMPFQKWFRSKYHQNE